MTKYALPSRRVTSQGAVPIRTAPDVAYDWRSRHASFATQKGQAMVEFAIVLPILIVLTIGSIYLTLSFIQKSRLNAIAFMSARAGAVRQDPASSATWVQKKYREKTGQAWLDEVTTVASKAGESVSVQLTKPAVQLDILANAIDAISAGSRYQPQATVRQVRLPDEFWQQGDSPRPSTAGVLDYRYGGKLEKLEALIARFSLLKKIMNVEQFAANKALLDQDEKDTEAGTKPFTLRKSGARMARFYDEDMGWPQAYESNSEAVAGNFATMKKMGENFKAIEQGGNLIGIIAELAGFSGPLKDIIGDVIVEFAEKAEEGMGESITLIEANKAITFSRKVP